MNVDYVLHQGDNLKVLPAIPDSSIDLLLTDPPYGWSFMGKEWDKALPSPKTWPECYRVLKPGGSCVVMSGARLDCLWRMCRDLEEAGFELQTTAFFWCYRSGFPKGTDLSKAADTSWVRNPEFDEVRAWLRKRVHELGLTHKEIDRALGNENSHKASHYIGKSQPLLPTPKDWDVIKQLLNVEDDLHRPVSSFRSFEREIVAERKVNRGVAFSSEGPDVLPVTIPTTDTAKSLDGWFTKGKVKPAVEVIIWARKPTSEKTELDNMVRWGVGGVNCGECMVPSDEPISVNVLPEWSGFGQLKQPDYVPKQQAGRFPANLIVTDEALGLEDSRYFDIDRWAAEHGYSEDWAAAAEAGVLQIPKPSKAEKDAGCKELQESQGSLTHNDSGRDSGGKLFCQICGKRQGACSCVEPEWGYHNPNTRHNNHPTCKPVTLMAYIISFLTKPDATVLDPFCGSGTTLVAAMQTGRNAIGIELEPEYCTIARARADHALNRPHQKKPLPPEPKQQQALTLFN